MRLWSSKSLYLHTSKMGTRLSELLDSGVGHCSDPRIYSTATVEQRNAVASNRHKSVELPTLLHAGVITVSSHRRGMMTS